MLFGVAVYTATCFCLWLDDRSDFKDRLVGPTLTGFCFGLFALFTWRG